MPSHLSRRRLLAGALSLAPALALADETDKPAVPVSGKTEPRFAALDELLTLFLKRSGRPGAALSVARGGDVIYSRGFGYADRDAKQSMKPESLFRISSISKSFTAVAVLRLVDQGKVKLDDKVADVLALKPAGKRPDERWKKVTIRHLLEHRGGWDHKDDRDPLFNSPQVVKEMGGLHPASQWTTIRYVLRRPLDFEPGEKFVYCNFGYCLLGRVIEKLGGQGYEAFVKKQVLEPLGLKSAKLGRSLWLHRAAGEVRYHSPEKGRAVLGLEMGKLVSYPYGAMCLESMDSCTGWIASVPDLVRFAAAFEDPKTCKILEPATVEEMFARPEGEDKDKPSYFAKGWQVQPAGKGLRSYWHDASLEGVSGMVARRFDGLSFAVMINSREKVDDMDPTAALVPFLQRALSQLGGKP